MNTLVEIKRNIRSLVSSLLIKLSSSLPVDVCRFGRTTLNPRVIFLLSWYRYFALQVFFCKYYILSRFRNVNNGLGRTTVGVIARLLVLSQHMKGYWVVIWWEFEIVKRHLLGETMVPKGAYVNGVSSLWSLILIFNNVLNVYWYAGVRIICANMSLSSSLIW